MRIAVGSDHAGFNQKRETLSMLRALGHEVLDVGAEDDAPSDYPDFAEAVSLAVLEGRAERGILICGSGVGASIAANKLPGIRAAVCHDVYSAGQGVEHDDMNVLVLGSRVVGPRLAELLIDAFLSAHFSGYDRHVRRLAKVRALERKYGATE